MQNNHLGDQHGDQHSDQLLPMKRLTEESTKASQDRGNQVDGHVAVAEKSPDLKINFSLLWLLTVDSDFVCFSPRPRPSPPPRHCRAAPLGDLRTKY